MDDSNAKELARPPSRTERVGDALEVVAIHTSQWVGGGWGFALACAFVVAWACLGPFYDFSESWQLVINTGTTVVTFLMVFLIQRSQNKESRAMQLKLNEIVAALKGASNGLIDIETMHESDLERLARRYHVLAQKLRDSQDSHSVREAPGEG
jgi:low affinity Fe/Cu permease